MNARIDAATAESAPPIDAADIDALEARISGRIVRPDDAEYDEARRVWNGMIDRRPGIIVRPHTTNDVIAAVDFARTRMLPLAVRGGGHNVSGIALCDDGVVIDLSEMRAVLVDTARKRVTVEGGAVLGDVDRHTIPHGLIVPSGVVPRTGIGGLTLHGGMGFLTRRYGLTCDHIVSAQVVTADGRLITASQTENSDLLWALRGGGGSFGIVTSFEFEAREIDQDIWITMVFYPLEKAARVLETFRDHMAGAPDPLMALAIAWSGPYEEFIPVEHQGTPVIVIAAAWTGPMEEAEDVMRSFRTIDTPIADVSGPMPVLEAQTLFDPEYPDGRRYYWKSIFLDALDERAIDVVVDFAARRPSSLTSVDVWGLGGAMARVDPSTSAFYERTAPIMIGIESNWDDPADDDANVEWSRALYTDLQQFSSGRSYLNFPGFLEEGEDGLEKSFGPNYNRLREIKTRYDPQNLFRFNLRIPVVS